MVGDSVAMHCTEIGHPISGKEVGEQRVYNSGGTEAFEEDRAACAFPLVETTRLRHGMGRRVLSALDFLRERCGKK